MAKKQAAAGKVQTLEELRKSEDRVVLVDGKWDDRYLAKIHGVKHHFWNPVEMEKHLSHKGGEKDVAAFKGELPGVLDLVSLYDYEKGCMVPAAVKMGFKTDDWYWAKEDYPGDPDCARMVNLKGGFVVDCYKDVSDYVRCVRLSQ